MTRIWNSALLSIAMAFASGHAVAAADLPQALQGAWVASRVVQDGKAAPALIGHRLTFDGVGFRIDAKDGKALFTGTAKVVDSQKPAKIDFVHTDGELKGKSWKGIYRVSRNTLTVADNAPNLAKPRPRSMSAKAGSGHVLFVFTRASN